MPKHFIFDKLSDKKKTVNEDSPSSFKIRFQPFSDALIFDLEMSGPVIHRDNFTFSWHYSEFHG